MAKRRRKSKTKLRKGQCKTINTKAGRRRICRLRNGKVRFKKLSYRT